MSQKSIDRVCTGCQREFKGKQRLCPKCQIRDRECVGCGQQFRGTRLKCNACTRVRKPCPDCGLEFTSVRGNRRCVPCALGQTRGPRFPRCPCGRGFAIREVCWRCERERGRQCLQCFKVHYNRNRLCHACRTEDRACACGNRYRGSMAMCRACIWAKLPPGKKAARKRQYANTRRALKRAAEVVGPVPAAVYESIIALGECVYCGGRAEEVDHVIPLARGGWEHPSNLAPACQPCNGSKGDRLLIEWDRVRVERAAVRSVVVAALWCAVRPA